MEMLAEKKMLELKHIEAIKKEYNNKMKEAIEIVTKLKLEQQKREGRREAQCKRKLMPPFMRKLERRRYGQSSKNSTTPTSPENTSTSPDSPQTVRFYFIFTFTQLLRIFFLKIPAKAPLYAQLNSSSRPESVTMATQTQTKRNRRRHSRTSSGSFLNSACSRSSSNRTSILVDTETQTDYIDLSEKDISPMNDYASPLFPPKLSTQSQRVILQEIRDCSDSENSNGNAVQLHFMPRHAESGNNPN